MRQHGVILRRPSTSTVAALFVVTACLLVLGINGWSSIRARQQQLAATTTAASNLAHAVSRHANDTLRVADAALIGIVEKVEKVEVNGVDAERTQSMHQP